MKKVFKIIWFLMNAALVFALMSNADVNRKGVTFNKGLR